VTAIRWVKVQRIRIQYCLWASLRMSEQSE
jgi:hypothetical protein